MSENFFNVIGAFPLSRRRVIFAGLMVVVEGQRKSVICGAVEFLARRTIRRKNGIGRESKLM